jgi:hypothetical protein
MRRARRVTGREEKVGLVRYSKRKWLGCCGPDLEIGKVVKSVTMTLYCRTRLADAYHNQSFI